MRKFLMGVAACLPLLEAMPAGAAEIAAGGDDRDLVEQIISRYQRMAFKHQQMAESLAI